MLQLWKSIVIPRIDYCSQLWSPQQIGLIQQIEELQRSFLKRITGFKEKDYSTALKELGLYSLQRRRERYQVIYLWSIIENHVPNISTSYRRESDSAQNLIRVHSPLSARNGRTIYIKPLKAGKFATLRFNSLPFFGARLFNHLPKHLRNCTGVSKDFFKSDLNKYLKTIPDSPLLRSNYSYRQQISNSLLDMANKAHPIGPRCEKSALVGCH